MNYSSSSLYCASRGMRKIFENEKGLLSLKCPKKYNVIIYTIIVVGQIKKVYLIEVIHPINTT